MKISTVKEYLEWLIKNGEQGNKVYYRSQEGDGDSASMEYNAFIEKYGSRLMGDIYTDDFRMVDGTRNINQFIKYIA